MFGYCNTQWASVISPAMPPRSIVDPLAGGYRRMPVMQIGADVFCDTKLMGSELATLFDKPALAMETCGDEIRDYSNNIDTAVFMAGVQTATPIKMLIAVFKLFSPLQAVKFIKDRAGIQQKSSVKPLGRTRAIKLIENHYADMESRLKENDYLFGESPSIADFSAYHNLWFSHMTTGSKQLDGHEAINTWFKRMSKFGHAQRQELSKETAFNMAKEAQPRAIPGSMKSSDAIGKTVEISPSDYAKDSVIGVLVADDASRWVIARETDEFGTLHVHFPKLGFEIKEI